MAGGSHVSSSNSDSPGLMRRFLLPTVGVLLYVVIAVITYWAYIRVARVDVVLYASLLASCLALCAYALAMALAPVAQKFSLLEKVQNLVICALVGYAMAITLPTVIDRSLSFYLLEKLQQRGGGIQRQHMDVVFREEYMREHRLMDIRLTEQIQSGTIAIGKDDCVRLTLRGERLANFSRFFRAHFLPEERLIGETYSNDLVNPFAINSAAPNYLCDDPKHP